MPGNGKAKKAALLLTMDHRDNTGPVQFFNCADRAFDSPRARYPGPAAHARNATGEGESARLRPPSFRAFSTGQIGNFSLQSAAPHRASAKSEKHHHGKGSGPCPLWVIHDRTAPVAGRARSAIPRKRPTTLSRPHIAMAIRPTLIISVRVLRQQVSLASDAPFPPNSHLHRSSRRPNHCLCRNRFPLDRARHQPSPDGAQ